MRAARDEPAFFKLRIMVPVQIGMMGLPHWWPPKQVFSALIHATVTDTRMLRCCVILGHIVLCRWINRRGSQFVFGWNVDPGRIKLKVGRMSY